MAYPTDRTLYWRTDSSAGTQDGTTDTAGSSGTAAFASLKDLMDYVISTDADLTGQGPLTLRCTQAGLDSPSLVVSTSGLTTTASDYLLIECTGDARHNGVSREKSGTGYQLKRSGNPFTNSTRYIRFSGIELCTSGATSRAYEDVVTTAGDMRFTDCLFTGTTSGTNSTYLLEWAFGSVCDVTFTNCLIIANNSRGCHFNNITTGSVTMDHCGVAAQGTLGILPDGSADTFTNTWAVLTSSEDWWSGGASPSGSHNASEDGTAAVEFSTGAVANLTLANEFTNATTDPATADFTLVAGSNLIAAGTGSLGTDITGASRTGTADIGPFNYSAATGVSYQVLVPTGPLR